MSWQKNDTALSKPYKALVHVSAFFLVYKFINIYDYCRRTSCIHYDFCMDIHPLYFFHKHGISIARSLHGLFFFLNEKLPRTAIIWLTVHFLWKSWWNESDVGCLKGAYLGSFLLYGREMMVDLPPSLLQLMRFGHACLIFRLDGQRKFMDTTGYNLQWKISIPQDQKD